MPLFEYACRNCDREFELLIRGNEAAECPQCQSTEVDKLLSAASAHRGSRSGLPVTSSCPPADAPPCGPGCCRL